MQKKLLALIVLVCLVATPLAFMAKVGATTSPTLQVTGQVVLPIDANAAYQGSFVASGNYLYLYCGLDLGNGNVFIVKVDETSMTIVGNCTTNFGVDANYPMFVIGNYLYCLGFATNDTTFGMQDFVVKIDTSSMTVAGNFSDPNGSDSIRSFGSDGTYLYINEYLQPPYDWVFYKVDPSTLTIASTSDHFAYGVDALVHQGNVLLCKGQDGSLYEVSTSNFSLTNYYQVGVNISATFWNGPSFGASNIFSGIEQHILKFSPSDFSQVGEWNDANDDYVSCFVSGDYLVAGLMPAHSHSETLSSIALIDSSTMTPLSTIDAPVPNGTEGYHLNKVFGASNVVYGYFSGETGPDLFLQLTIVTPSVHHGGGGGLPTYTPTPTPIVTPSQFPSPTSGLPVTNVSKTTSIEIFAVTVLIALSVASWMFLVSRRRR